MDSSAQVLPNPFEMIDLLRIIRGVDLSLTQSRPCASDVTLAGHLIGRVQKVVVGLLINILLPRGVASSGFRVALSCPTPRVSTTIQARVARPLIHKALSFP